MHAASRLSCSLYKRFLRAPSNKSPGSINHQFKRTSDKQGSSNSNEIINSNEITNSNEQATSKDHPTQWNHEFKWNHQIKWNHQLKWTGGKQGSSNSNEIINSNEQAASEEITSFHSCSCSLPHTYLACDPTHDWPQHIPLACDPKTTLQSAGCRLTCDPNTFLACYPNTFLACDPNTYLACDPNTHTSRLWPQNNAAICILQTPADTVGQRSYLSSKLFLSLACPCRRIHFGLLTLKRCTQLLILLLIRPQLHLILLVL